MVIISGHAYPWDVIGDPGFADRVRAHGIGDVTLAAAYHSTRAATPLHPAHQVIDARYAALYRPVREQRWDGRRLRPLGPDWVAGGDPFGGAAAALRTAGLRVSAWIVLTHNTRLGTAHADLVVTNCFGDRYPYALCPAHAEVREYAATLAAEAVRDVPLAGISLEACGQLGLEHNSHHEKTAGAWTPTQARVLSICCCPACRRGWLARGLDPAEVVDALRSAVAGNAGAAGAAEPPEDLAGALLATRQESTDLLRTEVLDRLAEHAPSVPVTLHAQADPWATGSSPGLTPAAAKSVDALLVPAWPTDPAKAAEVARAAEAGLPVDAYVTILPPAEPDAVVPHVRRLVAAGASRLSLYHLGLAPSRRQAIFREVVDAVSTGAGHRDG
jgi:hypothetical protein